MIHPTDHQLYSYPYVPNVDLLPNGARTAANARNPQPAATSGAGVAATVALYAPPVAHGTPQRYGASPQHQWGSQSAPGRFRNQLEDYPMDYNDNLKRPASALNSAAHFTAPQMIPLQRPSRTIQQTPPLCLSTMSSFALQQCGELQWATPDYGYSEHYPHWPSIGGVLETPDRKRLRIEEQNQWKSQQLPIVSGSSAPMGADAEHSKCSEDSGLGDSLLHDSSAASLVTSTPAAAALPKGRVIRTVDLAPNHPMRSRPTPALRTPLSKSSAAQSASTSPATPSPLRSFIFKSPAVVDGSQFLANNENRIDVHFSGDDIPFLTTPRLLSTIQKKDVGSPHLNGAGPDALSVATTFEATAAITVECTESRASIATHSSGISSASSAMSISSTRPRSPLKPCDNTRRPASILPPLPQPAYAPQPIPYHAFDPYDNLMAVDGENHPMVETPSKGVKTEPSQEFHSVNFHSPIKQSQPDAHDDFYAPNFEDPIGAFERYADSFAVPVPYQRRSMPSAGSHHPDYADEGIHSPAQRHSMDGATTSSDMSMTTVAHDLSGASTSSMSLSFVSNESMEISVRSSESDPGYMAYSRAIRLKVPHFSSRTKRLIYGRTSTQLSLTAQANSFLKRRQNPGVSHGKQGYIYANATRMELSNSREEFDQINWAGVEEQRNAALIR